MNEVKSNECPRFGCGYKKCARCYWSDNCPCRDMDEEEMLEMKKDGKVNPYDFANFDNVKDYYNEYCEYYTPFDDDEIAIIEYEQDLKYRTDYYQDLVDEQDE